MQKRETLREQIERTRMKLDDALEMGTDVEHYYRISVELDKMIEQYIDSCEKDQVSILE